MREYRKAIPEGRLRPLLYVLWEARCPYCLKPLPLLWEVEHIRPRVRGGSDAVYNQCPSCPSCNRKKGDQTAEEFGHPRVAARAVRIATVIEGYRVRDWDAVCILKRVISDLRSRGEVMNKRQ